LRVQRRNADEQQKDNSFSEQVAEAHPEAQTVGLLLITCFQSLCFNHGERQRNG
jgi:hypothetical protein